jgi:DNA repair exonuclease SbcCD ATPase subunit
LRDFLDFIYRTIQQLNAELKQALEDVTAVQNELDNTQNELLEKAEWVSPSVVAELSNRVADLQNQLDVKNSTFAELQSEHDSLQEEYDAMLVAEGEKFSQLSTQLSDQVRLYEQALSDKELLQQEVRKLHQQCYDLKTSAFNLQKQIDKYSDWISPKAAEELVDKSKRELESHIVKQDEEIQNLREDFEAIKQEYDDLQESFDKSQQSEDLKEKLDISLVQMDKLKEIIQAMKVSEKLIKDETEGQMCQMREAISKSELIMTEKDNLIKSLEQQLQQIHLDQISMSPELKTDPRFDASSPIVYIDIGSFTTKVGFWDEKKFVLR